MLYCACCSNPLNDGCVETTIPTFSDQWSVQLCYSCHWFSPTQHSEIRHVNAVSVFLVDGTLQESARCMDCKDMPCPKHALAVAKSMARSKLQETRNGDDSISRPVTHEEHVMTTEYHMRKYQEYMDYHKSRGTVVVGGGSCGDASMMDTTDNEVEDDENWEEYFRTIHPRVDELDNDDVMEENGAEQKCSMCNAPFPWHDRCANCESQSSDAADDPPPRDADDARCLSCNAPTGAAWSTHCWPECPRDNMTSPDSILAELSAVERQPLQPVVEESKQFKSSSGQTRALDPDWEVESEMRASKRARTGFAVCDNCGCTSGTGCEECAFVRRSMSSKGGSTGSPVKMLL